MCYEIQFDVDNILQKNIYKMLHTSIKMTKFICNRDMTMKKIRPSKRIFIFSKIEASFSKAFFPDDLYPQFIS